MSASFSKKDLNLIEDLASVFFTEKETAIFMKIPWQIFEREIKNENSEIHLHYYSGWRQSEYALRKLILNSAKAGSTPAQNTMMDIQKKAYSNRLR
ncbi:MAG: hypothetical protein BGO53_08855 [Sphingobacteriales bacterium 39-19]|nr:hypothetical protein [Sphingobacteriales bacterium]OJW09923.1 MAG: hypothetical protein BGO53_08855 [Sphingobacteriales bacterium 39-19]